jgi:imidazolonepropionase-like amidohydrolase
VNTHERAGRRIAAQLLRRGARPVAATVSRGRAGLESIRARRAELSGSVPRGVAFAGTIWAGGDDQPAPGVVVVDGSGRIAGILAAGAVLPTDLLVLGGPNHWVVPAITDAHVHLGLGGLADVASGVTAVRDLGAPLAVTRRFQTGHRPSASGLAFVAASGPILTADGGYPSQSWGRAGYAEFVRSPAQARSVVQNLATEGVDLIKIAFEPGAAGWPVLGPQLARAIVLAAHSAGLPVIAHALRADLVSRAVDIGVDELAHTPTERLAPALIERLARAGISVTSTLQTFFSDGDGRAAADNAADLVAAGVRLRYGTDLGNTGTRPGVDPRELDRLADAGLGRLGALRAATEYSATAPGMRTRTGRIIRGDRANLVLLPFSPLDEPGVWRIPSAVFADGRLSTHTAAAVPAHNGIG